MGLLQFRHLRSREVELLADADDFFSGDRRPFGPLDLVGSQGDPS